LNRIIQAKVVIGGAGYRVLGFSLGENLNAPGRLACSLFDDEAPLPRPGDIVGKSAVFTLSREDGAEERSFAGIVASAELGPGEDDVPSLDVVVVSRLWQLEKRADCRVFQKKGARAIVEAVLEGAGIPASGYEWRLAEDHPDRLYVAQYRETDLAFLMRLCAEEGIYFGIQTKDEADIIVFSDAPDGLGDVGGRGKLSFFESFGFDGAADRCGDISRTTSVRTDKIFVRDYDPEKPSIAVEGEAEGTDEGPHVLEAYEWPARAKTSAEAKQRATVMLEAAQAERDIVTGKANSLVLLPGYRFSIDGHPYDPINEEYLVTGSTIKGSFPRSFSSPSFELDIAFRAIPTSKSRCRPPRIQRERQIAGAQTALPTGPSGEEIHTDAAGRVKIIYPWDRLGKKDDSSSLWVRTLQLATGGSMLLPRVGWEVVVAHDEGDVDRPIVFGRMYNALTPPPYLLPAHAASSSWQTATTPGGGSSNELKMGDTKGAEAISITASKDMSTDVLNNVTESIGNQWKKNVGSSQARSVTNSQKETVASNVKLEVGGNQATHVETFMTDEVGSYSLTVGGNRDMKIGGDHKQDVAGSSAVMIGGNSIDAVVGSVSEHALGSSTDNVGAALIDLAVGERSVTVGGDKTESEGALKLVTAGKGRAVEVKGSLDVKAGGAIVNSLSGAHAEEAGGTYTEIAAGARIVKAKTVTYEAESMLTLVMGASIVSLTPASVAVLGISVKLDGDVSDLGIVIDN